jgi:DNA polymerase III epsilon subunit-like protein
MNGVEKKTIRCTLKHAKKQTLSNMKLPSLQRLSQKIGKPVSVFDLETTGLLDDDLIGITEMAWLTVHPNGDIQQGQHLIDPECLISEKAAQVSGIRADMVVGQKTFDQLWPMVAPIFSGHALFGFNSNTFDVLVMHRQLERYQIKANAEGWAAYDVRVAHQIATKSGQRGTLSVVAEQWGIGLEEKMHRAGADVRVTAILLDAILEEYGFSTLRDRRIRFGMQTPALLEATGSSLENSRAERIVMPPKNEQKDILSWVMTEVGLNGYQAMSALSNQIGVGQAALEELVETAIDTGGINFELLAHESTQSWLAKGKRLEEILRHVYPSEEKRGKLIYPFQILEIQLKREGEVGVCLDYIQLRVAFKRLGVEYQTRRKLLEEETRSAEQNPATWSPQIKVKPPRPRGFSG